MGDNEFPVERLKTQTCFELDDLPDELMLEIFSEMEVRNQRRLRRVSKAWLQELSSIRLQKVVRMDISIAFLSFDTDYKFTTFFDLHSRARTFLRTPVASGVRSKMTYKAHLRLLFDALTERTKVLQLNWIESTKNYNLSQSMTLWYLIWVLVVSQREARNEGTNLTHLLLDNIVAMEGLHNLSSVQIPTAINYESAPHNLRTLPFPPVPLAAIAFRRCRFELIGRFVGFSRKPLAYQDCEFEPFPADCPSWVHIPVRVLRLSDTTKELEENLTREFEHFVEDLKPTVWETLPVKVTSLPENAKLRWKTELRKNEAHYFNWEIKDIDLATVEWKNLRPASLLFFLSFKNLIVAI